MAYWAGQDWAFLIGAVAGLLTVVGSFITSMVTLWRLGRVESKVDGMLVTRDASNVSKGERIGRQAGDDASAQRDEGARQERVIQREALALASPSGVPVPVADDRTAIAAEKGAAATERIADAAEIAAKP